MNKTSILTRILPAACAGFLLLNGCASQKDMRKVNLEMHTLDNRLIEIEESIESIKKQTGSTVDSVQKKQAGLGNTLDELNTRLLQTKGQLEESRHRYRSLNAELIRINKELDQRLNKVESKTSSLNQDLSAMASTLKAEVGAIREQMADMQRGIEALEQHISSLDQQVKGIKQARLEEKAARARKAAEAASAARQQVSASRDESGEGIHRISPKEVKKEISTSSQQAQSQPLEQEKETAEQPAESKPQKSAGQIEYEAALNKFNAGNYREAQEIFSELRDRYGKQEVGIKARFMVADCLFRLENFSLAILEYQQVISDHPGHDKVPHALYNQAAAFEKLGDEKTAEIVYRKLMREFPKSEEADLAQKKI